MMVLRTLDANTPGAAPKGPLRSAKAPPQADGATKANSASLLLEEMRVELAQRRKIQQDGKWLEFPGVAVWSLPTRLPSALSQQIPPCIGELHDCFD